ncbi:MAG: hypothetical protein JWR05_3038 [Mucilaginibacter sp.]|nr:hypothetical protein [Mucilaginibacter sp.]
MKTIVKTLSLVLITLFCVGACKKDNTIKGNTTLTGKWLCTGGTVSDGWKSYFVKATTYYFVEFKNDGTLGGTAFNDYKNYTIKDSTTIKMTKADTTQYEDYYYSIKGDSLVVSPRGPIICFEGCSEHFVKVK